MSAQTVESIKAAIRELPEEEQSSLASWLTLQTMDSWDQEMQRDFAEGGRGAAFLNQAKREAAESA